MLAGMIRQAVPPAGRSFEFRHTVRHGREDTFALFADPANLARLTPPLLRFRIVDRPARIERGSRFRYRVGPMSWVAEITEWDPPNGFADVQVRGPYRLWRHRHELAEVATGTEVRDRVEYRLRGGTAVRPLEPLHRAFLRALFSYRSRRLDELLG
jgi:ligand-binding SRPBCC domain-containing protein